MTTKINLHSQAKKAFAKAIMYGAGVGGSFCTIDITVDETTVAVFLPAEAFEQAQAAANAINAAYAVANPKVASE